jgi:hypothetical protein
MIGSMTNSSYKDLDALVPDEVTAKLGGKEYVLPGDLPLDIYLRINRAGDLEDEDEQAALDGVVKAMVDLFSYNYQAKPEYEVIRKQVDEVLRKRGVRFNTSLLQNLYGTEDKPSEDGEKAENPTP